MKTASACLLIIFSRYVIADYDQRNFTVAQAAFDDTAKPNIVPIPWNATAVPAAGHRLDRRATIGISAGSAVFALLLATAIIFLLKRRRQRRAMRASAGASTASEDAGEVRAFSFISTQEMGHQSVQELHDSPYQIELLDEQVPSGSGNNITELPDWDVSSRRELFAATRQNSDAASPSHAPSCHEMLAPCIPGGSTSSSTGKTLPPFCIDESFHQTMAVVIAGTSTNLDSPSPESPKSVQNTSTSSPAGPVGSGQLALGRNKPLPSVPTRKHNNITRRLIPQSPPSTLISESAQVSPVTAIHKRSRLFPGKGRVMIDLRMMQDSTYAAVFDVDDYRGDPIRNEEEGEGV